MLEDRNAYLEAKDELDKLIRNKAGFASKYFNTLVRGRSITTLQLVNDWRLFYSRSIPGFQQVCDSNPNQLGYALGQGYMKYWRYVINYRLLFQLKEKISHHKIYSFEFYFLRKANVLNKRVDSVSLELETLSPGFELFYRNPLLHFLCNRYQKQISKKAISLLSPELIEIYSLLMTRITDAFLMFARSIDETDPDFIREYSLKQHLDSYPDLEKLSGALLDGRAPT